jgi:hypothetical protein
LAGEPALGAWGLAMQLKWRRERRAEERLTWTRAKELFGDFLIVFLGVWLLAHLVLFWLHGWIFVGENSKLVLTLETILALGIVVLGIDRILTHLKGR